ncbi:MAG: YbaY family lipoprotein, partial [Gammaproteobacteria bacterium]
MITAFPRARGRNRTARTAWTGGLLLAAALLVAGCVTDMTNSTIFGTATFRERMLLSPGSVLEVSVIEASDADASG